MNRHYFLRFILHSLVSSSDQLSRSRLFFFSVLHQIRSEHQHPLQEDSVVAVLELRRLRVALVLHPLRRSVQPRHPPRDLEHPPKVLVHLRAALLVHPHQHPVVSLAALPHQRRVVSLGVPPHQHRVVLEQHPRRVALADLG